MQARIQVNGHYSEQAYSATISHAGKITVEGVEEVFQYEQIEGTELYREAGVPQGVLWIPLEELFVRRVQYREFMNAQHRLVEARIAYKKLKEQNAKRKAN